MKTFSATFLIATITSLAMLIQADVSVRNRYVDSPSRRTSAPSKNAGIGLEPAAMTQSARNRARVSMRSAPARRPQTEDDLL
jgi:hypothetical protein